MAGRSKRIDTKVSILLGLHLPLFLSLAQIRDRRPLRYGERQSGYHCVSFANYSQFTDSVLLHMRVILHRRDITVSRNSLARCNGRHLRIRHLVQFILAGPVYHNALTNCATRVCCACAGPPTCVAERYLTLRTGCERYGRKNPLPFPFRSGHISAIGARLSKGKG